jgi:site-specific DNA-methyltransferase (adenine-specific)
MLTDGRLRKLVDYPDSRSVFQGVDVAGGICYFLWDRDHPGECEVISHRVADSPSSVTRPLLEAGADVFIRHNEAISILHKVMAVETDGSGLALPPGKRFADQVSSQKPFGLRTYFRGSPERQSEDDVVVLQSGGRGYVRRSDVTVGVDLIDKWKVFTSKSSSEHAGQVDRNGMRRVLSLSGLLPPGSVVTETYVLLGCYDAKTMAENCLSYVTTKFFRFMVATRSSAQDLARSAYSFVPVQDFTRPWDDGMLYARYKLSPTEIEFIESTIRPMAIELDG